MWNSPPLFLTNCFISMSYVASSSVAERFHFGKLNFFPFYRIFIVISKNILQFYMNIKSLWRGDVEARKDLVFIMIKFNLL